MKKLLLFFAFTVAGMFSCDPIGISSFMIENGTNYEITVEIEGRGSTTIASGEKGMVYEERELGGAGDYWGEDQHMSGQGIKINNVQMSNSLWKRKYWTYRNNDKHNDTYTLTVTDELIERFSSEELQ